VAIPAGLVLDSLGPDAIIESAELLPASPEAGSGAPRGVVVRMTEQGVADGTFEVHLSGRYRIDPSRQVKIRIFEPVRATQWTGRVLLMASPEIDATVENTSDYSPAEPSSLAAWSRTGDLTRANSSPLAWLGHDQAPPPLSLDLRVSPRLVSGRSRTDVRIEPQSIEISCDFDLEIANGSLDQIALRVPPELTEDLEVEGLDIARRELTEALPDGRNQLLLRLSRSLTGRTRFRARSRISDGGGSGAVAPGPLQLRELTIDGVPLTSRLTRLLADESIDVQPLGSGWREAEPGSEIGEDGLPVRWILRQGQGEPDGEGLTIRTASRPLVELPAVVIPRMLVRTTLTSEDSVRVLVSCNLDRHRGELRLELPRGATWLRAAFGETPITEIEELDQPSHYRLRLARADLSDARVATLEYVIPGEALRMSWWGPRFPPTCRVGQTFWEVRLPWNWAVLGVPDTWYDENLWYWDRYVWKRRPRHTTRDLEAWVQGAHPGESAPPMDVTDATSPDHAYLFSQPIETRRASLWLAQRPSMVAIASGTVLLVGLLAISWSRRLRVSLLVMTGLLYALALAWYPSLAFQFLQSSTVGIALLVIAAVLHRLVTPRTVLAPPVPVVLERPTSTFARGTSLESPPRAGSDDSTIIRQRTESTADAMNQQPETRGASSTPVGNLPVSGTP
jgi:hypothetical protein